MKKGILFTIFFLSLYAFSYAQVDVEVDRVQQSLVSKVTATWCPNCGTWGWTFFEDVIEDNEGKAIFLGTHYSGNLKTDEGVALGSNFSSSGQPQFFLGNSNQSVNSGNANAKRAAVRDAIDSNYASMPNIAVGARIIKDEENDNLWNIHTKTSFYENAAATYSLGVLVIEHDVMEVQSGQNGGPVMHPYVVRKGVTPSVFGEAFSTTTIDAGTDMEMSMQLELDPTWNTENVSIVAIVWEEVNGKYQYVNAIHVNEVEEPIIDTTNTNDLEGSVSMSVVPSLIVDQATVQFDLNENISEAEVVLLNVNGQKVSTLYKGGLNTGANQFLLNKENKSGWYIVGLLTKKGSTYQKVVFQ